MTMLRPDQKVFGLGLSKTGTSSLTEALERLGVRAIHYPYDARTYDELRRGEYRLSILAEYQAVLDIPVAPFYAQLDQAWPGAKFILTVREKEAWLRSAEVHWRLLMQWWERYPDFQRFHEFISACTYGTIGFSRERFGFVYNTHLRNVREYFADRPDDFLEMDICGGEGWERLCPFLGMEAPGEPFPHANEWMHLLMQAAADVERVIPRDAAFLLVDEQGFGADFGLPRRRLPFLERGGVYWGAPPDDATALAEFERTRRDAAPQFIAFGWPSFWWLEHYPRFAAHLRQAFPCVLENERLVVFDLRG